MTHSDETYEGGFETLIERFDARREGFDYYKESFPDLDVSLDPMTRNLVPASATGWREGEPKKSSSWARKRRAIAKEFVGNSELAYLNAMLIANLRRKSYPPDAPALFVRLWAEQSDHLIDALSMRWKVSSVQTFADHGASDIQRQAGQALRMLFGVMKLYEYERLHSGKTPVEAWSFTDRRSAVLPLDMELFSLKNGGLDVNILAPVWELARQDVIIAPLVDHLLDALNHDPAGVFRRLQSMRSERAVAKGEV